MSRELDRLRASLADRYEIEREIGAGGMATVYLARDLHHERRVALKVLRPDLAEGLGPDRFLQEVRVTAHLQHPHILPLFESGEADGLLYYVMPYIEGESLRERLEREGELPVPEVARLLRDVVDALAAAHRAGIVHRDVKPENVLLTGRHALVADFGVAKALTEATGGDRLTTVGAALGTPHYMAPEQASAESIVDHRADLYAVGAMAYELLAGRPPFTGTSPRSILTSHVTRTPEPISEHRAAVPPGLGALIMRCLEKRPADRWQSADEMLPHLEAAMTPSGGHTPTGVQPVAPGGGLVRGPRAWATVAGVVALLGTAAVWALGSREGEAPGPGAAATAAGADLDTLRVAVVPFENRAGTAQVDVWGELAADAAVRLTAAALPALDVVPPSAVREVMAGTNSTPRTIAEALGARWAVAGSYTTVGDEVRFDVEITDVATGELLLGMDPLSGPVDPLQPTLDDVGERVAAASAAYLRPNAGATSLRGKRPPSRLESLALFLDGFDSFCRQEYSDALATFERIVEIDPEFTFPSVVMVAAYGNGGRATLSLDSIHAIARGHAPRMSQGERTIYTWTTTTDPETRFRAALDMWRGSSAGFNQALAGHALAISALPLNRLQVAAEAIEDTDFDDPCFRQWAVLWTPRTTAHHLVENYTEERIHAREARRRFPVAATFVLAEARAAAALGETDSVARLLDELETAPASPGAVVSALVELGRELERHGHPERAAEAYARAHALAGERSGVGRAARAEAAYRALPPEEALPWVQAYADESPGTSDALAYLALTLQRLGRTAESDRLVARIREVAPTSRWPAVVAGSRGDARRAVDELRRAIQAGAAFYGSNNLFLHNVPELEPVRDAPVFQAFMRPRG